MGKKRALGVKRRMLMRHFLVVKKTIDVRKVVELVTIPINVIDVFVRDTAYHQDFNVAFFTRHHRAL